MRSVKDAFVPNSHVPGAVPSPLVPTPSSRHYNNGRSMPCVHMSGSHLPYYIETELEMPNIEAQSGSQIQNQDLRIPDEDLSRTCLDVPQNPSGSCSMSTAYNSLAVEEAGVPGALKSRTSPSFFNKASQFQINNSEFSTVEGDRYGSVNIVIHQGSSRNLSQETTAVSSVSNRHSEKGVSVANQLHENNFSNSFFQEAAPASEIYRRQLLPRKHGFPLWIPSPNAELSHEYRRIGASIGDVGIITSDGGWDYLFNIRLPAKDPRNPPELPDGFVPLEPTLSSRDIYRTKYHGRNAHIASASVRNVEKSQDIIFHCSEKEGAILVMPEGADREDIRNLDAFQEYIMQHAGNWYKFVNGVRGRRAENSSLHVVTGCDKTLYWGMAIYSKFDDTDPATDSLLFKFKPSQTGAEMDRSSHHTWELAGPALTEAKTGPDPDEGGDESRTRMTLKKGHPSLPVKNQCIFLRTFAVTLNLEQWEDVQTSLKLVAPLPPLIEDKTYCYFGFIDAYELILTIYSWIIYLISQHIPRPILDKPEASPLVPVRMNGAPIHPLHTLNQILLDQNPTAKVVITHDSDWFDLLRDDDIDIPPPSVLRDRMQEIHSVFDDSCTVIVPRRRRPPEGPVDYAPTEVEQERQWDETDTDTETEHDPSASVHQAAVDAWNIYRQKGRLDDLEQSLLLHTQALEHRKANHPHRCESLLHIGLIGLWQMSMVEVSRDFSEKMQSYLWEACKICPPDSPLAPVCFAALSEALDIEFAPDIRDLELIEEALFNRVQIHSRCRDTGLSPSRLSFPFTFVKRGEALLDAIFYGYTALNACHPRELLLQICFPSLMTMLDLQYANTKKSYDLRTAIEVYRDMWPFVVRQECPKWLSILTTIIDAHPGLTTCHDEQLSWYIPMAHLATEYITYPTIRLGCFNILHDLVYEAYLRSGTDTLLRQALRVYAQRKRVHLENSRTPELRFSSFIHVDRSPPLSTTNNSLADILRLAALISCRELLEDEVASKIVKLRVIRQVEFCVIVLFDIKIRRNTTVNVLESALGRLEKSPIDVDLRLAVLVCLSMLVHLTQDWNIEHNYRRAALDLCVAQFESSSSESSSEFVRILHRSLGDVTLKDELPKEVKEDSKDL